VHLVCGTHVALLGWNCSLKATCSVVRLRSLQPLLSTVYLLGRDQKYRGRRRDFQRPRI
jgi:hypothetical protein